MSDYQMPLFEWYPIEVELERRRGLIREAMKGDARIYLLTDGELTNEFETCAELCPIELWGEREWSKERDGLHCSHTLRINYHGDDELWRLFPRPMEHKHPLGEIIQGRLVLSFLGDRSAAERAAEKRLEWIESILNEQREMIEAFQASFPSFIVAHAKQLGRVLIANDA